MLIVSQSRFLLTTFLMHDDKRPPPRLPVPAPKDDRSSSASLTRSGQLASTVPLRARFPLRSRTGCWTCRTRKRKCDEQRPKCALCTRQGYTCDYALRLTFRDETTRVQDRIQKITRIENSKLDPNSPARTYNSSGSMSVDDLPHFAAGSMADEGQEKKVEHSCPDTYVVDNQDGFKTLLEYNDGLAFKREPDVCPPRALMAATHLSLSERDIAVEGIPLARGPEDITSSRFEDITRQTTLSSSKNLHSQLSSLGWNTTGNERSGFELRFDNNVSWIATAYDSRQSPENGADHYETIFNEEITYGLALPSLSPRPNLYNPYQQLYSWQSQQTYLSQSHVDAMNDVNITDDDNFAQHYDQNSANPTV
ncbi:hypothetical protein PV08_11848 [Exophiala spinifera]|uniref:Zn(2)-C6 fungal-type domain-containing protein n=1 Tax=Exophiala spinifera TaxID=91928 RepID=A0A0D1ZAN8_9EURO|nr:uncharacterized protein PV08_11848 [Exophiala spinifera]KIW10072.1 hypothetical protein PV08_11848 [Exophiala spinifera]